MNYLSNKAKQKNNHKNDDINCKITNKEEKEILKKLNNYCIKKKKDIISPLQLISQNKKFPKKNQKMNLFEFLLLIYLIQRQKKNIKCQHQLMNQLN